MNKISRFVFNFRDKCNMRCPYCYIPFIESDAGDISLWIKIVDTMALYSPDIITFGGGDPFAHNHFVELIEHCNTYSFQVHVDTNGLSLPASIIPRMSNLIALTGLPLDGSRDLHDRLRRYQGHFDTVCCKLDSLAKFKVPVKINTVLFPKEKTQLIDIAKKISQYPNIKQWFIYEYWHFKGINSEDPSSVGVNLTYEDVEKLHKMSKVSEIHYSTVSERSPSYIFISSLGNIYTIAENAVEYIELGNLFSENGNSILSSLTNLDEIDQRAKLKRLKNEEAK